MPKPKHEQMDWSGLEIVADEFTGTFNGPVEGALTGVTALTNNSGGTADNTIAAIGVATPAAVAAATGADTATLPTLTSVNASITYLNTQLTAIRNDVADLAVKINQIITALS